MKTSEVGEILAKYKLAMGSGIRTFKAEPHIAELKVFYKKLPKKDRELTPSELHELIKIGLGKKNENDSASATAFKELFKQLGDKKQFRILEQQSILNPATVSILVSKGEAVETISLLQMFAGHKVLEQFLEPLQNLNINSIPAFYHCAYLLSEKELLTDKNIKGLFHFATDLKAITNLGILLPAMETAGLFNQENLKKLFNEFEAIKVGSAYVEILQFIADEKLELNIFFDLLIHNNNEDIKASLVELKKMMQERGRDPKTIFFTVLNNLKWQKELLAGLKMTKGYSAYITSIVLSNPQYAARLAEGLTTIESNNVDNSRLYIEELKKHPEFADNLAKAIVGLDKAVQLKFASTWLLGIPEKAEIVANIVGCLTHSMLCNEANIKVLQAKPVLTPSFVSILTKLLKAKLLTQKNFDALTADGKNYELIEPAISTLAGPRLLTQTHFDKLITNPALAQYHATEICVAEKSNKESTTEEISAGKHADSFFGGANSREEESQDHLSTDLFNLRQFGFT